MNQVIETWEINNRIYLYLIDSIAEENLKDIATSKDRTVGEQLAHIHNVRLMWLKESMPELLNQVSKDLLIEYLKKSGQAINCLKKD